ncbi:MarR family transcriptional regulator [Planomonospora parontospora]|uniref:MarR family transcriptional regulator n=1 Tax=Planomonospora parontospora TaxID=58119 RepID=UPI0016713AEC|nr:MarR family transcriptional regulator [Planomonospora parontospora]GGL47890.1 ArsR family transcriptional regulator [Planomonospora parontospora subsp. antibiotica]GII18844.1 ArsR family transcriptional regulator [Planomonospora parontospora subsp. antibiotica]
MREHPPLLLPLFRSGAVGELLAWLYLHPEQEYSTTELAQRTGASQATVSREANRFAAAGLTSERRHGNLRLIRADTDTIVAKPLTDLLAVTFGPAAVLPPLLQPISGIDEAYVYGSWAARYANQAGPLPRDVDVLVVGTADEDELYDAARAAERSLGREVNISRISPASWAAGPEDPFVTSLRSRPLYPLIRKRSTS